MINFKLISKILGQLLFIEATLMALCLLLTFYYKEDDIFAFLVSFVLTVMTAILLSYRGRNAQDNMTRRDAYMVVSLAWVLFSLMGSVPFMVSGHITNFTDAFFEAMSGFTTTGASIIENVEGLPPALLFWRTMTQWIGGLGIVFFTIAILPSFGSGGLRVFSAEATGPIRPRMHPRLSTQAKWIWSIYMLLTATCGLCYFLSGMDLFDAVNYAMTTTATGGFSTHNESTGYFHNVYIDYTAIVFMLLSGTSFTLIYLGIFKWRIKELFRNSEFKFYLFAVSLATVIITIILFVNRLYGFHDSFRYALFQVTSFITTTGIFNADAGTWPHITWVILSICMFMGACSGSTSGGFKCIRMVMSLSIIRNEFKRMIHPNAVLPVRINGSNIPTTAQVSLFAFFGVYFILCLFTYFVMIISGVDGTNSITISLSCASNVGPTLGLEIGPTMSWSILPDIVKWLLCALMLMGRLEIFTIVVLFTRSYWKNN